MSIRPSIVSVWASSEPSGIGILGHDQIFVGLINVLRPRNSSILIQPKILHREHCCRAFQAAWEEELAPVH